ncbi:hypothetical protein, partial [Mycobacterium sp.]|uniref:hypothetical protein n=1 Tax=Mycobacterium sp. TaxID=1785 RepID=UPI002D7E4E7D
KGFGDGDRFVGPRAVPFRVLTLRATRSAAEFNLVGCAKIRLGTPPVPSVAPITGGKDAPVCPATSDNRCAASGFVADSRPERPTADIL